jgi:hypothetical protein
MAFLEQKPAVVAFKISCPVLVVFVELVFYHTNNHSGLYIRCKFVIGRKLFYPVFGFHSDIFFLLRHYPGRCKLYRAVLEIQLLCSDC